jgi:hypothetical protein
MMDRAMRLIPAEVEVGVDMVDMDMEGMVEEGAEAVMVEVEDRSLLR